MRVNTQNNQFETNAQFDKQEFKIASNAKAFEILTNTLYKDVKASIVRELISNGHDGHVRKGNLDTPIKVHCPTVTEPFFEVRDFGCSMDEHTINHIYTTFFSSTKNDNNEEVGGFGLGCKLPFAYTDAFTVTTYLKGKKQEYIASKENGFPVLLKAGEAEDTTEPDGVQVTVPVFEEDCEYFENEIKKFIRFSHFNIDAGTCTAEKPVELDNGGFKDFHNFYGSVKETYVNIGGVPYLLDYDSVTMDVGVYGDSLRRVAYYDTGKRADTIRGCLEYALDHLGCQLNQNRCFDGVSIEDIDMSTIFRFGGMMDFDVGELDVTASRESLQYSDKTIKAVMIKVFECMFSIYRSCMKDIRAYQRSEDHSYPTVMKLMNKLKPFLWMDLRCQDNTQLPVSLGEQERSINLSDSPSLEVIPDNFFEHNNFSAILKSPKYHSYGRDKKFRHKNIYDALLVLSETKCRIHLTNAKLKYCGLEIDDSDNELFNSCYHQKIVITVDPRSDVKTQGEALQQKLDGIAQGLYEVITIDRADVEPKEKASTYRPVVLDENGDKPMDAMAKKYIAACQGMIERFGAIYYYSDKIPQFDVDIIGNLSMNAETLGLPDLHILLDSRNNESEKYCHGRAFSMLSKFVDCPVIDLSDSKNEISSERSRLRNPLFYSIRNIIKQCLLQYKMSSNFIDMIKDWKDFGLETPKSFDCITKFNGIYFNRYVYLSDFGIENGDHSYDTTAKCIIIRWLKSLDETTRYKAISWTLLNHGRAYLMNQELKEMFTK